MEGLKQFNGGSISLAQHRALVLVQVRTMVMAWHVKSALTKSGGAV